MDTTLLALHFTLKKVLLLYLVFFFFTSILLSAYSQTQNSELVGNTRRLLEAKENEPIKKTSSSSLSTKNQTKLIIPTSNISTKNQTKLSKTPTTAPKNQTKLIKLPSDSPIKNKTTLIKPTSKETLITTKPLLKKLNSTSSKPTNSTKTSSLLTKKPSDLNKPTSPKTKTTPKLNQTQLHKNPNDPKSKNPDQKEKPKSPKPQKPKQTQQPNRIDQEDDEDDLISGFRDLPTRFQETLLPDLETLSKSSKVYLTKANKEITKGFKPFVGNRYASTIASIVPFAFITIPLVLVSLIFHRIKAYFSLQKLLIFIQVYLSIYFSILCLSSLVTGLEPLRFFYATSQSTYVGVQVFQTLGYVLYLLLLLMYLVLVFSTDTGLGLKLLGLGQTFVGFAVGLHYYVTVFHRVVLRQPPRTNWKVHGIYATCFLVICLLARAERRKKAYLEEGGEEGKKS